MRWRRRRRHDPRARLAQDIRRISGFMAVVVDEDEDEDEAGRLDVHEPDLAAGCVNAWSRWGRHLEDADR
jgi:hypothetical protein